uniref:Ig-like domain-containing protein n=1 Tax=Pseudonaja textilis TaxID=8673 RepID=A0A670YRQ5_PSETE
MTLVLLMIMAPDTHSLKDTVMLKCIATDYRPPSVTINWVGGPQNKKEDVVNQRMADGTYWTSSQFTTTLSQWQEMNSTTCEVVHHATSTTKFQKISRKGETEQPQFSPKASLSIWLQLRSAEEKVLEKKAMGASELLGTCKNSVPPPTIYLLKPPLERLFIQNRAILSCLVVGYELENIMFTWTMDGLNLTTNATTEKIKTHTNRTQSFQSQLNLTSQTWDAGKKIEYSCQKPSLSLVLPPLLQLTQATSQAVAWLACVINGFFPSEILIKWKKNNRSIDASEYITGPSILETGNSTFSTQSVLKIPASEWENRAVYTCLVGHESLTIMKNISKYLYGKSWCCKILDQPRMEPRFNSAQCKLQCES